MADTDDILKAIELSDEKTTIIFDRLEEKIDRAVKLGEQNNDTLRGTGDSPGLVGRVNNMETINARRDKIAFTAIGGAILALVKAAWDVVTGGNHGGP